MTSMTRPALESPVYFNYPLGIVVLPVKVVVVVVVYMMCKVRVLINPSLPPSTLYL